MRTSQSHVCDKRERLIQKIHSYYNPGTVQLPVQHPYLLEFKLLAFPIYTCLVLGNSWYLLQVYKVTLTSYRQ